jgi:tagatose-1,6-bisphosphate aldolase
VSADGKLKLKNHLAAIEMRRVAEAYAQNSVIETIELPLASDILLGKGKPFQEHIGNMRLHALVDEHLSHYIQCSGISEKTILAAVLVKMVQGASGRFLSKDRGVWIEVSDDIAREKVCHVFRARRPVMRQGRRGASIGIEVRCATDPNSSAETIKRVKR